jgi:serine/threonine protein phosphatase PrpC
VSETPLTSEDEFIVVGCKGLWNNLSQQEIIDVVRCLLAADRGGEGIYYTLPFRGAAYLKVNVGCGAAGRGALQVMGERNVDVAAMRLRDMALAHGGMHGDATGLTVQGM